MKKLLFCILITASAISKNVFATGMPVFDLGVYTQTLAMVGKLEDQIKEAEKQYQQMHDLSKTNNKQYDFLQHNLSGNYGYGHLLNNTSDMYHRQWSNDSWVDVLRASNNGHASAFADAQRNYDRLYPVVSADHIAPTRSRDNLTRTHYQQSSEISRAALAASSYSYDQINEHIKNIHDMLAMLENEPSEKAAIDINTRLVAELGFIQIEMLRQQNIQNQLTATQTQGEVNGMSEQSQFMQW